MKKILKVLLYFVMFVILAFGAFLLYITLTDYQPEKVENLMNKSMPVTKPLKKDTFNLMTWNIGYAGLGAEMDFFYDGGHKVRPTKSMVEKYLKGIESFVKRNDTINFWLIQEVDKDSHRSYGIDEVKLVTEAKKNSIGIFAKNYDCPFVPVPLYEPMGKVVAGQMTFSQFPFSEAKRYAYPLIASWPDKLFLLDRCFILTRFPLKNGKDLIILNTHNSAYVYDSSLRVKELNIMKKKMVEEFNKGNYVVAGGDWNANPPLYKPEGNYHGNRFVPSEVRMNINTFPPSWKWAYDASAPTNRQNNKRFVRGENGTTCIDYFVLSPNIKMLNVKTIDLNFQNSDHNPVYLKIVLKQKDNFIEREKR